MSIRETLCKNKMPTASATTINLLVSAFLASVANLPLWRTAAAKLGMQHPGQWLFIGVAMLVLWMAFNLLFSLLSIRQLHKPLLVTLLCVAAICSYYMQSYGIVIDKQMITNLLETDVREASEQITWQLFVHVAMLGILPSLLLLRTRITYRPWRQELLLRGKVVLASLLVLLALVFAEFKDFVLFGRENKMLRMYVNPTYPIYSMTKTVTKGFRRNGSAPPAVIGADARRPNSATRSAVVLVVGETARAEQFSLNGYSRPTNPELARRNVITYDDVQACGTDTAESLPCMFFHQGKANYSRNEAKKYENLLDVLQRTGVRVIWRDNNSGSKGVGDRVIFEDLANAKDPNLCASGECYDEILLGGLDRLLAENRGDLLIVLHQKGSHGPSYYKRTPKEFKRFLPECTNDNVQDCDRQSIVNAYDNTILYTDHLLSMVIDKLKSQSYATAMLYVSDHGESLGENNIYLHGLPYVIAPQQQTRIPMIFWASDRFLRDKGIDRNALANHRTEHVSHDNLFHSMLGLFNVATSLYQTELNLFRPVPSVAAAPLGQP